MASVVLLGTLDTKGAEYAFLRDRVRELGCDVDPRRRRRAERPVARATSTADEVAAAAGREPGGPRRGARPRPGHGSP